MIKLKQIIEGKDSKDAAGIAYFFNDTLLCCQNNEGRWGIPKGHIHIDETPEEGALREFSEETQILLNKPIEFSHKAKKDNGGNDNSDSWRLNRSLGLQNYWPEANFKITREYGRVKIKPSQIWKKFTHMPKGSNIDFNDNDLSEFF